MKTSSKARMMVFAVAMAVAVRASAEPPLPEVGSAAPGLELAASDGSRHSLAAIDGPTVLIFYRGLW